MANMSAAKNDLYKTNGPNERMAAMGRLKTAIDDVTLRERDMVKGVALVQMNPDLPKKS